MCAAAAPAAAAAAAAAAPAPRPVARPAAAGKKVLAPRKPAAKSGGLGVKKLATKVDDSLFDQKPAEPVAPVPVGTGAAASEGTDFHLGPLCNAASSARPVSQSGWHDDTCIPPNCQCFG